MFFFPPSVLNRLCKQIVEPNMMQEKIEPVNHKVFSRFYFMLLILGRTCGVDSSDAAEASCVFTGPFHSFSIGGSVPIALCSHCSGWVPLQLVIKEAPFFQLARGASGSGQTAQADRNLWVNAKRVEVFEKPHFVRSAVGGRTFSAFLTGTASSPLFKSDPTP